MESVVHPKEHIMPWVTSETIWIMVTEASVLGS